MSTPLEKNYPETKKVKPLANPSPTEKNYPEIEEQELPPKVDLPDLPGPLKK